MSSSSSASAAPEPSPCTLRGTFTFAAVGDLIGPVRPETPLAVPGFAELTKLLNDATVSIANHEGSLFDVDDFEGCRAAEHGGGYPVSDIESAVDVRAMGFDILTKANNHATDWGVEGLVATNRALRSAGVLQAGSGTSKMAARAPAFLETPNGRVAVLAAASTFTPMSEAGHADGEVRARAGISVLKTQGVNLVPEADFEVLRRLAGLQGLGTSLDSRAYGSDKQVTLGQETFRPSASYGLAYEMNRADRTELVRSVRGAKQVSDFVVFALHGHESQSGDGCDRRPADFMSELFHEMIDAGADSIVTTGPHLIRGVELYKGKPIFYGLGSFFLELESGRGPSFEAARTMGVDPMSLTKTEFNRRRFVLPDDWYDSVLTVSHYDGARLDRIELHPVRLIRETQMRAQGYPRRARGDDANRILNQLKQDCAALGTEVTIDGDLGIIRT